MCCYSLDSVVDDFQSHYHLLNAQQQAFLPLHPDLAHVGLRLSPRSKDTELWFRLCPLTNEMIVTKQGRYVDFVRFAMNNREYCIKL